ncbi:MAG: Mannose-1-phosphate guanylyltransferase (GDP), mannose-6-phosphate isomerase, type 2 [Berkelbacteria bacterium GW2011_GWB1_38_5]|uniref:Mannose-1-phosphate guanylyltransferase (GDP), mannose-6-phosphate isomerase, type 2 n=1 Tax=Berkelbacteria bacterium GW2011_GWB1_38_5 TaxID=1618336 RepID=A0A0G0NAU8_9BACT|nr:MAG: Mannose-1-phosphate guanylyltransferase (GDP), mannose-6-phosphate isomerase, type 2 [Berkelbacteria bacterium GW2011_GWB1_38_5]
MFNMSRNYEILDLEPYFSYNIDMNKNFYIVLMAGGSGTRLWPMSRKASPKQFHKFSSDRSLLQGTYDRIKDLVAKENIHVSLTKANLAQSQKQLKEISINNFIIEPEAKNTGPSIALITAHIFAHNPQAIIATIASDHTVEKINNYKEAISEILRFATKNPDYLSTIGIKPSRAETGFGYIKVGKKITNSNLYCGEKFVEKPDKKKAQKYLESGDFLWNASYFAFSAGRMLGMYKKYSPLIYNGIKNIMAAFGNKNADKILNLEYAKFPTAPFDTIIAEKHNKIAIIPADLGWSDIGSWASLYDLLSRKIGGHTVTEGHHVGIDNKNCLIYAKDKLLATVGLEDIIIVDTKDVTLVCNKNKSQDIKKLLEKLKIKGKSEYL